MNKKCYYDVLEVDIEASHDKIQRSFRNLVKQWHPDVCNHPEAEKIIKELNEAYEILKDEYTRDRYDSERGYDLKKQQREEFEFIKEKQSFSKNFTTIDKKNREMEQGYSEAFSKFKTMQNEEKIQKKKPKEERFNESKEYDSVIIKWFFPIFIIFIIVTIIVSKK